MQPASKKRQFFKSSGSDNEEKNFEKQQKNLVEIIKAHTFATRSKKSDGESKVWHGARSLKFFESLEAIAHKSSIYGKVILAKNIDNMTSNFERN